jgi:hypothetical protein
MEGCSIVTTAAAIIKPTNLTPRPHHQGLDNEKADLRLLQKDLRRQQAALLEEGREKNVQLAEQRARCRDVQLLKFGREIDAALLDTIGVRNHAAEELQQELKLQVCSCMCVWVERWRGASWQLDYDQLVCARVCSIQNCYPQRRQQERAHAQQLAAMEAAAAAATRDLLALTRANTAALDAVGGLTRGQRALEAEVLAHRPALFGDPLEARRAAAAERHALVGGVNARAAAMQELRGRVEALRRKDSVLYAGWRV